MKKEYPWRKLYEAAMLELDPKKLQERIEAAHAALQQCAQELLVADDRDGGPLEERLAIADALHSLRTLQKVELGSLGGRGSRPGGAHPAEES
ncbi:MAG TPA: hypothetical protein VJX47_05585 [Candidatus Sulfotelmatobacter sp.]|nr:hypothetical protein [Candidatus Sulfotelmatobacter sp.]